MLAAFQAAHPSIVIMKTLGRRDHFVPPGGHLAVSADIFDLHGWWYNWHLDVINNLHVTGQAPSPTENYQPTNVNSGEVEMPWSSPPWFFSSHK